MNSKEALIDLVAMGALRLNKEAAERLAIVEKDLYVLETIKGKMSVEIETKNGVTVAKLKGDLDHHTAKDMRSEIDREIKEKHSMLLILDFYGVTFMDSSGIGLVMGRYKIMEEQDGKTIIARPPAYIRKVMNIAGINKLTEIVSDYKELLKDGEEEKVETKTNE